LTAELAVSDIHFCPQAIQQTAPSQQPRPRFSQLQIPPSFERRHFATATIDIFDSHYLSASLPSSAIRHPPLIDIAPLRAFSSILRFLRRFLLFSLVLSRYSFHHHFQHACPASRHDAVAAREDACRRRRRRPYFIAFSVFHFTCRALIRPSHADIHSCQLCHFSASTSRIFRLR